MGVQLSAARIISSEVNPPRSKFCVLCFAAFAAAALHAALASSAAMTAHLALCAQPAAMGHGSGMPAKARESPSHGEPNGAAGQEQGQGGRPDLEDGSNAAGNPNPGQDDGARLTRRLPSQLSLAVAADAAAQIRSPEALYPIPKKAWPAALVWPLLRRERPGAGAHADVMQALLSVLNGRLVAVGAGLLAAVLAASPLLCLNISARPAGAPCRSFMRQCPMKLCSCGRASGGCAS